jgi:hypothetical protein
VSASLTLIPLRRIARLSFCRIGGSDLASTYQLATRLGLGYNGFSDDLNSYIKVIEGSNADRGVLRDVSVDLVEVLKGEICRRERAMRSTWLLHAATPGHICRKIHST